MCLLRTGACVTVPHGGSGQPQGPSAEPAKAGSSRRKGREGWASGQLLVPDYPRDTLLGAAPPYGPVCVRTSSSSEVPLGQSGQWPWGVAGQPPHPCQEKPADAPAPRALQACGGTNSVTTLS